MSAGAFVTVAPVASLEPDKGLQVVVDGRQIAIFYHGGAWHAIDNECPHKRGPLAYGHCEQGKISCPLHGWSFDLLTGLCGEFPEKTVAVHQVRIEGNDLQVRLRVNSSI